MVWGLSLEGGVGVVLDLVGPGVVFGSGFGRFLSSTS